MHDSVYYVRGAHSVGAKWFTGGEGRERPSWPTGTSRTEGHMNMCMYKKIILLAHHTL